MLGNVPPSTAVPMLTIPSHDRLNRATQATAVYETVRECRGDSCHREIRERQDQRWIEAIQFPCVAQCDHD